MTNYYKVGKIVNTHGIRGEVRVISTTDFTEERYQVGEQLFLFRDKQEVLPLKISIISRRRLVLIRSRVFGGISSASVLKR